MKNKMLQASKRAKETDEERKVRLEKDRERKREKAKAIKKLTYSENEKEMNRVYKAKMRMNRTAEQIEFDKLEYVLRKRQFRKEMSETEKETEKEKSRIGMQNLRLEGPIMEYQKREFRELDDLTLWMIYWEKGQEYQDLLTKLKPDTATMIKIRLENGSNSIPEQIVTDYNEELNTWHNEVNDIDDDEDKDMPEIEMSAYEKLREKNIKELEAAKKESGLFDD